MSIVPGEWEALKRFNLTALHDAQQEAEAVEVGKGASELPDEGGAGGSAGAE